VGQDNKKRTNPPQDEPWYAAGLRFECVEGCGNCCIDHGDYSYVYLEGNDLPRLANHLKLDEEAFTEQHTELDGDYRVLKMVKPACHYLKDTRCTVHPARPVQCSTFPFWKENLESPTRWRRLKAFCPGIDSGPVNDLVLIRSRLANRGTGD